MVVTEIRIIDNAKLRKTLHIECMKHKQQLKINFLAGKHNMKQCRPKMFLVFLLSTTMFMPASGMPYFSFHQFFSKNVSTLKI